MKRALVVALLLALACTPAPSVKYERVIVISLDTVRADALGCYGNAKARTPALDALAKRAIVFEDVTSAAPTTLASHASIFTGTHPHTHGIVRNGFVLARDNETLAEVLRARGFRTAGFLGSFALDRRFGIDQGFDVWDDRRFDVHEDPSGAHEQDQRRASAVTDAALGWVDAEKPERFLLFAHYFDAHAPYEPPPPFDVPAREDGPRVGSRDDVERAVRAQQARATGAELGTQAVNSRGLTPSLLAGADAKPMQADVDLAALYAGEVAYVDREVGRLLDGLEKRGLLESALIVVLADHGETFVEHADFWNHGVALYQSTLHVPLIVAARDRAARRVAEPVSSVDVLPTICALVGVAAPARVEGRNLLPTIEGAASARADVFAEATQPYGVERAGRWGNENKAKCVRSGPFKLIRTPYLGAFELYDLAHDPAERANLLAPGAKLPADCDVAAMRAALEAWERGAHPLPSRYDASKPGETRTRLEGLGYDEGAPSEPARDERKNEKPK